MEKGSYKSASEIYLALAQDGVAAYDEGAYDSDGGLGDFVSGCVEEFKECMKMITDHSYKDKLLKKLENLRKTSAGLTKKSNYYCIQTLMYFFNTEIRADFSIAPANHIHYFSPDNNNCQESVQRIRSFLI